jgi:hypothetical protein
MNSGSSASISSAGAGRTLPRHSSSSHQSRPSHRRRSPSVRCATSTVSTRSGALARLVDDLLERDLLAAAQALVGGDHDLAVGVEDAVRQRLGAEAAEDDECTAPMRAQASIAYGGSRDHRHVDADAVALCDAVREQHVGHPADLVLELAVADVLVFAGLVLGPDDRRPGRRASSQVPVDAVVASIDTAAEEPREVDVVVIVVEDVVPGAEPGEQLFGVLRPERLRVVQRETVEPLILLERLDVRVLGNLGMCFVDVLGGGLGHRARPFPRVLACESWSSKRFVERGEREEIGGKERRRENANRSCVSDHAAPFGPGRQSCVAWRVEQGTQLLGHRGGLLCAEHDRGDRDALGAKLKELRQIVLRNAADGVDGQAMRCGEALA